MGKNDRMQDNSILNTVGIAITAGVLSFAVSSAAVQYLDLDPWMMFSYIRIFMSVLFTMSICMFVFRNWKTFLVTFGGLALIALIIALVWMRTGVPESIQESATSYFTWLWNFITNWNSNLELTWNQSYATTVALSSLITVMMYFLLVKWFVYLPAFIISAGIFIAQWALIREVNKFAFYLMIISLVILYFLQIYRDRIKVLKKKKEEHNFMSSGRFLTTVLPLVLSLVFLVAIIPKSSEPIKWKWLDDRIKYRNVGGDKPIDFQVYEQFSLANTGFSSEPGKPGGSVQIDYSHILDVYSSEITYLRGESWPYFDGTRWGVAASDINYTEPVMTYEEYNAERMMLLEPVYGWRFMNLHDWLQNVFSETSTHKILPGAEFDSVTGEHLLPEWYTKKHLDIVYAGAETHTLFSPLYGVLTNEENVGPVLAESDDTLDTEEITSLFTFVSYDYLSMDFENSRLEDALMQSKRGIYYRTYSNLAYLTSNSSDYPNISISSSMLPALMDLYELYAFAEDYYSRYTRLPEGIPDRVPELAREIVKGHGTDYEMVKAIESYLHENYTYSLEVPDVPKDRDFTDWFLFDSKTGYCTYYATSMVTLVRSIGLPARYVEGFLTPPGPLAESRYPVLNANAHAWVEVYFEGVGWVRFEPTTAFAGILDDEDDMPNPDFEGDDPLDENLDELDKEDIGNLPINTGGGGVGIAGITVPAGWLVVFIILALYAATVITGHVMRKMLFSNVHTVSKFRRAYFELLRIMKIRGIRLEKGMTLMELASEVDEIYFAKAVSMSDLTDVYYRILYDNHEPETEDLRKMETFYKDFRIEFNSELKLWEWIVFRILTPLY